MDIQTDVKQKGQPSGGKSELVGFLICGVSAFTAVFAVVWALMHA